MRLFSFDSLITPGIIRGVFRLMLLLYGLAFLAVLVYCFNVQFIPFAARLVSAVAGMVAIALLVVATRVAAELTLVVFMIRDELAWQRENRTALRAAAE